MATAVGLGSTGATPGVRVPNVLAALLGIPCAIGVRIDGGDIIRAGVGDDGEIGFLVDGHAAGSSADSDDEGHGGCFCGVRDRNAVHKINQRDGIRATVIGDHSDARGSERAARYTLKLGAMATAAGALRR